MCSLYGSSGNLFAKEYAIGLQGEMTFGADRVGRRGQRSFGERRSLVAF